MFAFTDEWHRTLVSAVLRLAEANFAFGVLLGNVAARGRQTVQRRPPPLQDGDQTVRGGALEETRKQDKRRLTLALVLKVKYMMF